MSKIIKFEPILKDFDGKYDDQHDHKNCYKPVWTSRYHDFREKLHTNHGQIAAQAGNTVED